MLRINSQIIKDKDGLAIIQARCPECNEAMEIDPITEPVDPEFPAAGWEPPTAYCTKCKVEGYLVN